MLLVLLGLTLMGPLVLPACWGLFRRQGLAPSLSLLLLVPFFGVVIVLAVLALGDARPPAGLLLIPVLNVLAVYRFARRQGIGHQP